MTMADKPETIVSRKGFLALAGGLIAQGAFPASAGAAEDLSDADVSSRESGGEYTFVPDEELSEDDLPDDVVSIASDGGVAVSEIKGATRYETAAQEALKAYSSCSHVIVASGESFSDSLAAASLAGVLGCPIVLCAHDALPDASVRAIRSLGSRSAFVLGGNDAISTSAVSQVKTIVGSASRLWGPTRYETQMEVYKQGRGKWGTTAIIATATDFADALAVSPIAFALKAPIFFVDEHGELPTAQRREIDAAASFKDFLIIGGLARISSNTESHLAALAKKRGGSTKRLAGQTRYETSSAIASYAVNNLGFKWDGVAFTSGQVPFDALAGAPLQGRSKSPLLLVDAISRVSASSVNKSGLTSGITFLGGYSAIPIDVRVGVCATLGVPFYKNVGVTSYGVTLERMARLEEAADASFGKVSYAKFCEMLDPNNYSYNTRNYVQFAKLNTGYSGLSATALSSFVSANCGYSEGIYGRVSGLREGGAWFVNAAKTYGVNEVYLLAHAIWESGWGCSELANGWVPEVDGEVIYGGKRYPYSRGSKYYNFYGIGAVDQNALAGGRAMAVKEGWTSPEKAVMGAAKWIASNYLNRSGARQNTLYLMKFDLPDAVRSGSVWHQYCTGGNSWVLGIASVMASCYSSAGKSVTDMPVSYDVPSYEG